ncbi:MAG: general secretion pathway protein GspH [Gammaproteobacteria bacterium HGW-Gammaproteobacteria-3]|nr:MAG: general secretion pathway protein GspH [Gammaproteobacteria bacterium HGW-Gammaproteobacteria-3]
MRKEKGFSLLEILVAFAILALALGILLRIFSGGVRTAIVADGYTTAVQIAESLLAGTGVETPLQAGQSTGMENDTYAWQVTVSPFQIADVPADTLAPGIGLMQVEVSVSWSEGGAEPRLVELTTLKLVNIPS